MKISVIGPRFHLYNESISRGFAELGHIVSIFQWHQEWVGGENKLEVAKCFLEKLISYPNFYAKKKSNFNKNILEFIESEKADLILIIKPVDFYSETFRKIKQINPGGIVVVWMMDSISMLENIDNFKRYIDHFFLFEPTEVETLIKKSCSASFLPLAFNPKNYFRDDNSKEINDIFFCGASSGYSDRFVKIRALANHACKKNYSIVLAGNWWGTTTFYRRFRISYKEPEIFKSIQNGFLSHQKINSFYNMSKVSINIHHHQSINGLNMRTFEVAGAGGVLLTDYKKELDALFDTGSDLMTYATIDELTEKVDFLVSHPSVRNDIRNSARKTALERHTFKKRCESIINMISP